MPKTEQEYPKRLEVIDYLTAYETRYQFPVLRPVQVEKVLKEGNDLIVCSAQQSWRAESRCECYWNVESAFYSCLYQDANAL